ncbi:hypothetical protein N7510_008893 [Penicillium lagena]|uniref:uncharacterized protein n=1 Tax=Penicillium lagena TaxID=94218 RepID=UPI00253F93AA|nr:uncharacterized protein N7510_008893 [Penicillium lagena]KAJ5606112.1 hypothetical protein N7510_008893 [Penicillium lagena]
MRGRNEIASIAALPAAAAGVINAFPLWEKACDHVINVQRGSSSYPGPFAIYYPWAYVLAANAALCGTETDQEPIRSREYVHTSAWSSTDHHAFPL